MQGRLRLGLSLRNFGRVAVVEDDFAVGLIRVEVGRKCVDWRQSARTGCLEALLRKPRLLVGIH